MFLTTGGALPGRPASATEAPHLRPSLPAQRVPMGCRVGALPLLPSSSERASPLRGWTPSAGPPRLQADKHYIAPTAIAILCDRIDCERTYARRR